MLVDMCRTAMNSRRKRGEAMSIRRVKGFFLLGSFILEKGFNAGPPIMEEAPCILLRLPPSKEDQVNYRKPSVISFGFGFGVLAESSQSP